MRVVIDAIEGEYRRYKVLAENAIAQVPDAELRTRSGETNSIAIVCQHIAGNLKSRFTDFLTSDGEKPWRDREAEFADKPTTRAALLDQWEAGWREVFGALSTLTDEQLGSSVAIRGVSLSVIDALTRSLAHTSYHVGQIVLIARGIRGSGWRFLSIPPGQSAAYNANPRGEKPPR